MSTIIVIVWNWNEWMSVFWTLYTYCTYSLWIFLSSKVFWLAWQKKLFYERKKNLSFLKIKTENESSNQWILPYRISLDLVCKRSLILQLAQFNGSGQFIGSTQQPNNKNKHRFVSTLAFVVCVVSFAVFTHTNTQHNKRLTTAQCAFSKTKLYREMIIIESLFHCNSRDHSIFASHLD